MQNAAVLSALFILSCLFSASAQEAPKPELPSIRVSDLFIYSGVGVNKETYASLNEFRALAPDSKALEHFSPNIQPIEYVALNNSSIFSVQLGVEFLNKQKASYRSNPLLRIGIQYAAGNHFGLDYSSRISTPFDTLTSAQTGNTVYVDSIKMQQFHMNYSSHQLRFDGALLFRTNPEARWSLYAGIGISTGVSFDATTEIDYLTFSGETIRTDDNGYLSYGRGLEVDTRIHERFVNKANFSANPYVPMGVDFRLGKNKEFWKKLHLVYELRPGINMVSVPELRTFATASIQQGLALRVVFNP